MDVEEDVGLDMHSVSRGSSRVAPGRSTAYLLLPVNEE
jgi:hypothetical protein